MIKIIQRFFAPTVKPIIDNTDLYSMLSSMQQRIERLEDDNVELTNCLYEIENRLQSKIDAIHPVVYNIQNKHLKDLL